MSGKLGSRYDQEDIRSMFPGAAITQHAGVYVSGNYQVKMPTSDVAVECFGVWIDAAASGASTTVKGNVVTRGQVEVIAGEALTAGQKVTLKGTSGRFFVAEAGEPVAGIVLNGTGTAAGYRCLIELTPRGASVVDVVYTASASITDDTSFTLDNAAGTYRLVYAAWTADGVVTGGLKLGTTSGGAEIFTGLATSNGSNIYFEEDFAAALWTLTADDTLYLADVTAWNNITVSAFTLKFEKVF